MNIYEKLLNIQNELKAPKSQRNNFGNYNYRNCEDILESAKPILKKYNCSVVLSDELVMIGERYYVKANAVIVDCDKTTDTIINSAFAREEETKKGMDGSQITGASSSYARKYALNGLFCIDDTKDSDATNTHGKVEKTVDNKATPKQSEILKKILSDEQITRLFDKYKINDIQDLDRQVASDIISKVKK